MDKLTAEEVTALEASSTPDEYRKVIIAIKSTRNGKYPKDWYAQVMAPGGIHEKLAVKWNNPNAFKIQVV